MPPFPQPEWDALYPVGAGREIAALRAHRRTRRLPRRSADRLLLATWNIANLGLQERGAPDYEVLAEIVSWFDVVAVQETNDNLAGIRAVMEHLPATRRMLVSDASGNRERGAFIYDTRKVTLLDKVGRLSIPPSDLRKIKVPGTTEPFRGFDRGPFMAAFATRGDFRFLLVNVHLYFGGKTARHVLRRAEETYALAWWADRRHRSQFAYVPDIIPLGDFNLPQMDESDRIFRALTKRGLRLPPRGEEAISQVGGTSLGGLSHYDQIALFPGETTELRQLAIFDFDRVVFKNVYDDRGLKDFLAYTRFHLSDHRPLWAEFTVRGQSPS
jgi:endonuclease/exonuclease/phosphatase family metal-dependent hydrolase